jgi:Xaa-Pro aminopeptidase
MSDEKPGYTRPQRDAHRPIDATGFRESVRRGWGAVDRTVTVPAGLAQAAALHRRQLGDALPRRPAARSRNCPPLSVVPSRRS